MSIDPTGPPSNFQASFNYYLISLPKMKPSHTNPHLKRPRDIDAGPDRATHSSEAQVKRCRLSQGSNGKSQPGQLPSGTPEESLGHVSSMASEFDSSAWALSDPLAGQYSNLDPILTSDEE